MITVPEQGMSLRVVAERAGVSRMTVSLALRDDPSIPIATRRRVRKLARFLGYRPDPHIAQLMEKIRARKVRHKEAHVIAYLTAYENRFEWKKLPTARMYFEGAQQQANECGFKLEEAWLQCAEMTGRRLGEILHSRGIEGIIVAPLPGTEQLFQDFNWDNFSGVALAYSLKRPALHRACNHHFQSMFSLARELHARGYERLGLALSQDADERVRHLWRAGYLAAQSVRGGKPAVPPLIMREWNKDEFARWLRRGEPDAIITIGERVALWLKELGWRVPADVGLANVDLRPTMVGMTGIDQNSRQVGAAAVDLLVSLLSGHERGVPAVPRITMIEGTFVAGETVRQVAGAR